VTAAAGVVKKIEYSGVVTRTRFNSSVRLKRCNQISKPHGSGTILIKRADFLSAQPSGDSDPGKSGSKQSFARNPTSLRRSS
jgi:hypothetical protein